MTVLVNVKYITNGFTVNWQGSQAIGVPASLYAATIPEVVYWLGRIFDPVTQPTARDAPRSSEATPRVIEDDDPLLGQQAQVIDIASGGYLVSQLPAIGGGMKMIETYSSTMDGVADLLTQIFTPPPEPPVTP